MIVLESLVEEAGVEVRDSAFTRFTKPMWLRVVNKVLRDICSRRRVLEFEALGDVITDDRYPYPENLVKLRWVRFSPTPNDPSSYEWVKEETNEDRWRNRVRWNQVGDPERYLARQGFFQLDKVPAASIAAGLWIAYWGIPLVQATDLARDTLPIPDFFHDHVVEGMVIRAKMILGAYAEANEDRIAWIDREQHLADAMEDRSEDERGGLVPESVGREFEDQV